MCLLFSTFPQKELKIKIDDRVGNLVETPESERKEKTKCSRRRGSGSVYIRLMERLTLVVVPEVYQMFTKSNSWIIFLDLCPKAMLVSAGLDC